MRKNGFSFSSKFRNSSRRDNWKLASHNVAELAPANHRVLKGRRETFAQFHRALRHENYFSADNQPLRSWLISVRRFATWRLCVGKIRVQSMFHPWLN